MKLRHFTIVVTIPQDRLYWSAGERIEGNIYFQLAKPKMVNSVTITLSGKASVSWPKQQSLTLPRNGSYFNESSIIFSDMTYCLYGEDNVSREMEAGQHHYPFSIQIPSSISSSFEGSYGHIRYALTARISRPNKADQIYVKSIIVHELVNADTPQLITPISVSNEKSLGNFCCAFQPVVVSTSLGKRGYSVGKVIVLSVDCTHKRITYLCACLRQKVEYHAGMQIKSVYRAISGVTIDDWTAGHIHIPPAIVPTITNCRVIRVTYEVLAVLKFKIPGFKRLCLPPIPVTIGNVSSREVQPESAPTNTGIHHVRNSLVAQDSPAFSVQPSAPPASFCIPHNTDFQQPSAATNFSIQYVHTAANMQQSANSSSIAQLSDLIPNTPPPSYMESETLQDYSTQTTFNLPPEKYTQQFT